MVQSDSDNSPGTVWQLQQKIIQVQFDSDDGLGKDYSISGTDNVIKFPRYVHSVGDNEKSQGLSDDVSGNISTIQ